MAELRVYTTEEVMGVLKVTKRTLYNYIRAGQLKAFKVGREWRVTEDALRDFTERGTQPDYLQKLHG